MYIDECLETLQNFMNRKVTQVELSGVLGYKNRSSLNNRITRKSHLKEYEVHKIENFYGISFQSSQTENIIADYIKSDKNVCPYRMRDNCPCKEQFEIKYLECLPDEAKLPEITSVHKDAQIVKEHWHREPENLRIIPMQGDGLSTYCYPCQNRDILIIDINSTAPTREGLYAYSARNNTMLFVAKLSQLMDGTIKIEKFEATGEVTQKMVSPEKQKEVDFRVIGKVINNETLSL